MHQVQEIVIEKYLKNLFISIQIFYKYKKHIRISHACHHHPPLNYPYVLYSF